MEPATAPSVCQTIARTISIVALLAALALLSPPLAAAATIRYAAPAPTGAEDCSSPANACDLQTATTNSSLNNGDEVVLAAGEYTESGSIEIRKEVNLHGLGAPAATKIVSGAFFGVVLENSKAKLGNLEIDSSSIFDALFAVAGTVDEVIARSSGGSACSVSNTTLRDSLCVSTASAGVGVGINFSGGSHAIVLRNVTAIASGATNTHGILAEGSSGATVSIDAKNVIAHGTTDDVHASADATSTSTVTLDHSDFSKRFEFAQPGGTATITAPTTSSNQAEAPTFVNAALGDYHEAAGSVTIDAGVADASNGTADIDAGARTQGAAIDIGADEFTPPVVVTPPPTGTGTGPPPTTSPPDTSISKGPHKVVKTGKSRAAATFAFASGDPGASFECSLDKAGFSPCTSPRKVEVKKGKHSFTVRAIDVAGPDTTPAVYRWRVEPKQSPGGHRAQAATASAAGLDYEGNAIGNKRILVGFQLHGKGCPGEAECFENRPRVIKFNAVNTSFPNCPQILEGYFESKKAVVVGKNGSFESSEKGFYGEDISFGGRFVHEGRLARGWFRVDEEGCTTGREHWKAELQ